MANFKSTRKKTNEGGYKSASLNIIYSSDLSLVLGKTFGNTSLPVRKECFDAISDEMFCLRMEMK